MTAQPIQPSPASDPHTQTTLTLTLKPLLTDGQAALAPDLAAGVAGMALSRIELVWPNVFNEVTIRKADDLFACAACDGRFYDPIPKGADLVQATFQVLFVGATEPRAVHIAPPCTLTLQDPLDAPLILPLLTRRGFRASY